MGVVSRRTDHGELAQSLVFRARVDLYNFGITHSMDANRIIEVGGDDETDFIMFMARKQMLFPPIYRPEINIPIVEAFSQIKD